MTTETKLPLTREEWLQMRASDITSTEVAALFGCSPYMTKFELWHRKKTRAIVSIEENERMKWGTRLQDSIALGIAEDNRWEVRRMDEYMSDAAARMGASFDFAIEPDGILEIKNVDSMVFKDGWLVSDDNIEAPPHIEIQLQHQLAVSKRSFGVIGALVGGNRVVLIRREADPDIIASIRKAVAGFWESIDGNIEPKPDFERDSEFIASIYKFAEPGKVLDATGDEEIRKMAAEYKALGDAVKTATGGRDAIKAQLLMRMGDAEKVIGDGFSISAGMVGPAKVAYEREGYRLFKINWKKEKK